MREGFSFGEILFGIAQIVFTMRKKLKILI